MRIPLIAVLATLCAGLCAPSASLAQSVLYLRGLPEVSVLSVAHTRQVTGAAGTSSGSSSTYSPEVAINMYLGALAPVSANWLIGGELRGAISYRPDIEGNIPRGDGGTQPFWPGPWEFANRAGLGGNIVLARRLAFRNSTGFLFAGASRWNSDFRSAGFETGSEDVVEHKVLKARWPLTAGIGLTLPLTRAMDIRLRYFRSRTGWTEVHNAVEFDYSFVVHGLALSAGLGTR